MAVLMCGGDGDGDGGGRGGSSVVPTVVPGCGGEG
jgi:hypothetical protein